MGPPNDILSDNPFLFHNRHGTGHTLLLGSVTFPSTTFVTSGHINPPGTYSPSPSFTTWIVQPFFPFGPISPCNGANLQFGVFCFNDGPVGCPDLIPAILPEMTLGRRYNLEVAPGQVGNSNLQTFLGIWELGVQQQLGTPDLRSSREGASQEFEARVREIQRAGALRR